MSQSKISLWNKGLNFGGDFRINISCVSFQCLKESYVKALGTGIGFEVERLNFDLKNKGLSDYDGVTTTTLKVDGSPAKDWTFQELLIEDHCIAVAVNQKEVKYHCLFFCSKCAYILAHIKR